MNHRITKAIMSATILVVVAMTAQFVAEKYNARRQSGLPLQARLMMSIAETGGALVEVDQATEKITDYTHSLEDMLGYSPGALRNEGLGVLMPPWFREAHHQIVAGYRPDTNNTAAMARCWMVRHDGSMLDVVISVFPSHVSGRLVALVIPAERVRFKDMLPPKNQTAANQ